MYRLYDELRSNQKEKQNPCLPLYFPLYSGKYWLTVGSAPFVPSRGHCPTASHARVRKANGWPVLQSSLFQPGGTVRRIITLPAGQSGSAIITVSVHQSEVRRKTYGKCTKSTIPSSKISFRYLTTWGQLNLAINYYSFDEKWLNYGSKYPK